MTRPVPVNQFIHDSACLLVVVFPMMLSGTVYAQMPGQIDLERPGDRAFVLNTANMIGDADEKDKLLTTKRPQLSW